MSNLDLDVKTTALVLIDLQHMIVGRECKPHSAGEVVAKAATLAEGFREVGAPVVYVRVLVTDMVSLPTDEPWVRDPKSVPAANALEIVPEAGVREGDIVITKRQWGAFYDTGLDQQLRRRGIRTIVLGGISTNIGVESTARAAFDRGYALVFAEDAMTSMAAEAHQFAVKTIFPRMGRVRTTVEILASLPAT